MYQGFGRTAQRWQFWSMEYSEQKELWHLSLEGKKGTNYEKTNEAMLSSLDPLFCGELGA